MTPAVRQAYLGALGLQSWLPRGAPDWGTLAAAVEGCRRCALCETRNRTVLGAGDRAAGWLVIGEAPGAEEDLQGEPFVGRAGQLLNAMLRAIGLERGEVYIANILKCRPPGNRNPTAAEIEQCLPYLETQVALLRPRLILVVGRVAAQALLRLVQLHTRAWAHTLFQWTRLRL